MHVWLLLLLYMRMYEYEEREEEKQRDIADESMPKHSHASGRESRQKVVQPRGRRAICVNVLTGMRPGGPAIVFARCRRIWMPTLPPI